MSRIHQDGLNGSRVPRQDGAADGVLQSGIPIASKSLEQKEQDTDMAFAAVHPIDTLLVQQLENIINGEKALRARYSSMNSAADSLEVRMAFSQELSELKDRADRLYRFMNAMDFYGSFEPSTGASYSSVCV